MTPEQFVDEWQKEHNYHEWMCSSDLGFDNKSAAKMAAAYATRETEIAEERIRILSKMLRYIAFVLTGDENADPQLAADNAARLCKKILKAKKK